MNARQGFLRDGLKRGYVDMRGAEDQPGLSVKAQRRLLHGAGWAPAHPGLWVPDPDRTAHTTRCLLATRHFGSCAATGASALFLLCVLRTAPETVELLRPAEKWTKPRDGTCIHPSRDYPAVRTLSVQGVRTTWAPRALAEHARHSGFTPLVRTIADAIQARHCTLGHLEGELARGRFPGCRVLRQAVSALGTEQRHSSYERLARRLLSAAGIAVAARPLPVLAGTVPVAEVDLPFFEVSHGVEIDGPHHLLAAQAARDRARDRMLLRDHGITIDRYFWFELEEEPDRFVREVTARLQQGTGRNPAVERRTMPT